MSSNKTLPQWPKISELKKNKKNIKSLLYLSIRRGIIAGFSVFNVRQNNLGELIKTSFAELHPRVSDSGCLLWGPRIHISNNFPSDTAGVGITTLLEPLFLKNRTTLFKS